MLCKFQLHNPPFSVKKTRKSQEHKMGVTTFSATHIHSQIML